MLETWEEDLDSTEEEEDAEERPEPLLLEPPGLE